MKTLLVTVAATLLTARPAPAADVYAWQRTDHTLALVRGTSIVWQLHADPAEGKPYIHPLRLPDGTDVAALRPADHPWHRGLWWSWKLINGVNYWEEDRKTGKSQGETELVRITITTNGDGSASAAMELAYHPPGQPPLLTEQRRLSFSAPDARGGYQIDWQTRFTCGATDLRFDRTPPSGLKNGVGSGGYAGLSLRCAADLKSWVYSGASGAKGVTGLYGKREPWLDFSGPAGGVMVMEAPGNPRHPTAWYPNQQMPFFSPAFLFHEPFTLAAGQTLALRYRIAVHGPDFDPAAAWKAFAP